MVTRIKPSALILFICSEDHALNKFFRILPFVLIVACAQAQTSDLPAGSFATVNGQPLSQDLLGLNIQTSIGRGQADTPQLRAQVQNDLIVQEVLSQEAKKLKLDQSKQARAVWEQMQQNFLTGLLLESFSQSNTVSPAQIKDEYDIFVKQMQGAQQYLLSIITVPTEAKSKELTSEILKNKDKSSFAKLAKEFSIDPSRENGGKLEWLLPQQMLPAVSNVVVNLEKGKVSAVPIQTPNGWNIVRVEDVRPYKLPTMKELEPQLRQAATQKAWSKYIRDLTDKAKVVR